VRWNDIGASTPFQHPQWCEAWYSAFAGADSIEPLIANRHGCRNRRAGGVAALIRRWQTASGSSNSPISISPITTRRCSVMPPRAAPAAPRAFWRDLTKALRRMPGGADLIRLRKIPVDLDGRTNSAGAARRRRSVSAQRQRRDHGRRLRWLALTLEKTVRKELERSWRVFTPHPAAGSRSSGQ